MELLCGFSELIQGLCTPWISAVDLAVILCDLGHALVEAPLYLFDGEEGISFPSLDQSLPTLTSLQWWRG